MATSAKKKARERLLEASRPVGPVTPVKQCMCLASIRPRSQHAIDCPLFYDV